MPSVDNSKLPPIDVTWRDVTGALDRIHKDLEQRKIPVLLQRIVGIARGGLIPASMLAFRLRIYDVQSHRLQTYDVTHLDPPNPEWNTTRTLFVDDIYDSGDTAKILAATYPNAHIAVLFYKPTWPYETNKYGNIIVGFPVPDRWINFPWDYAGPPKPAQDRLPTETPPPEA